MSERLRKSDKSNVSGTVRRSE